MNKETIITTIVGVIVAVFDLLKVFGIFVPIEENEIYVIVSLIVTAIIYWRNQSWTHGGWMGTQIGRIIKEKERKGDLSFNDAIIRVLNEVEEDDD